MKNTSPKINSVILILFHINTITMEKYFLIIVR